MALHQVPVLLRELPLTRLFPVVLLPLPLTRLEWRLVLRRVGKAPLDVGLMLHDQVADGSRLLVQKRRELVLALPPEG